MSPKRPGPITSPSADRQIHFHGLLVLARKTWLMDALSDTVKQVNPATLRQELIQYAPPDVQQILAAANIRDEYIFPTPLILKAQPSLVGYYRLLLGVPRKTFYGKGTGMSQFKRMEDRGTISAPQIAALPAFCAAMSSSLAELVRGISPQVTKRDLDELPLLTLGQFFQGGNNNAIGQAAIKAVFRAIAKLLDPYIVTRTDTTLSLATAQNRVFLIALAGDPDIRIQETNSSSGIQNLLSIEVKGGTDKSNAYNRGGEAEKSHQAARANGYPECWTVIGMSAIDTQKLIGGSPATDVWFDTPQIIDQTGPDWDSFSAKLRSKIGV